MCIERDIHDDTELSDVAKLFFGDDFPQTTFSTDGDIFCVKTAGKEYRFRYIDECYSIIPAAHKIGRLSKIAVYDAFSSFCGKTMPWGALTGVRPTKLFYECLRSGKAPDDAVKIIQKVYRINEKRADVLGKIAHAQTDKLYSNDDYVNLYVHIPFCTTRCTYCSFVSLPMEKCRDKAKEYVDYLCDEILYTRELIERLGKKLLSVYVGGGTPTALDPNLLDKVLTAIGECNVEYTCEAGRPDTVTSEKCDAMRRHGVTRVCVNPQTLNEQTLAEIGRKHTVCEFFAAYDLVKSFGFDINCDLIAGLSKETIEDFIASFEGIKALCPQNFTVHSLSRKNGSAIRYDDTVNADTEAMLDYALDNAGRYAPYYLYRQKRQSGNLENVGFALPGKECINNITSMEETISVLACGAGAITKTVRNGDIRRFADMRDVNLYISRYEESKKRRTEFIVGTLK